MITFEKRNKMDYRSLSDNSRVWIYQADRELTESEVKQIENYGASFIKQWAAHGAELKAAFVVKYNRFLILFADETQVKASGCSIDSSVRFIKEIEKAFSVDLFNRMNIAFKEGDVVKILQMADFKKAIEENKLTKSTIVFNNLVESKADFEKKWEVPVSESWHVQLL